MLVRYNNRQSTINIKLIFGDFKELVEKFENETLTFIAPVKQIKKEEREKS